MSGPDEHPVRGLLHDREVLTHVLVYHWRRGDSGCGCGWGRTWPVLA